MAELFDYIWSQRYRPQKLQDMVLKQEHRDLFESFIKEKQIPNLLLSSNPGTGKSTTAKVLVNELETDYLYINASDETGIDTIRHKVVSFAETRSFSGGIKVIILDEADGLSSASTGGRSSAQQALRNVMEEYSANTRFILTANYPSKIIPALHSRCQQISLNPPLNDVVKYCVGILRKENVSVDASQKKQLGALIKSRYPDIRKIVNTLQQNTVDGKLIIRDEDERLFVAQKVFKALVKKKKVEEIRTYIISQETEFQDYHDLLTDLFEVVFASDLSPEKKAPMMLTISEAMYRHTIVMDQEINAFSTIIQLSQII